MRPTEPCICCGEDNAADALGYCLACLADARTEVSSGMSKLTEYLAAWAAFDEWLRLRGAGPAVA
jgi:hypothetical protein